MAVVRFFEPSRTPTLAEIADRVGGTLVRGADFVVQDICSLANPSAEALGYLADKKALRSIEDWPGALLTTEALADAVPERVSVVVVGAPQVAHAAAGRWLYPEESVESAYVAKSAEISSSARLEDGVRIEAGAVVGPEAEIGTGTVIGANTIVGARCRIGRHCRIGANVSVKAALIGDDVEIRAGTVIGEPGFGYVPGKAGIDRVVQVGRVIVQDKVHIGSNACIDRGTIGDTVIGEGCRIGNLQQIAHNVTIGRHCIVVGNGGIAGSATIGDGVTIAGGVFVIDHATIGAGATIAGVTMVRGSVPPGVTWGGIPARPIQSYLRDLAETSSRARKPARTGRKEE